MRPSLARSHRHREPETIQPLTRLRRRFLAGAWAAVAVFVAVFIIDAIRHDPGDDASLLGLEIADAAVGLTCASAATFSRMLCCLDEASKGEDMSWAVHLGMNIADNYRGDGANGAKLPPARNIR